MQQTKKFVCQYKYLGKKWVLHIDAASHADAEERAKRLGSLEVLGELGGSVDASIPGSSWVVRLKVWFLNYSLPNAIVVAPPPLKSDCAETVGLLGGCSPTPCSLSSSSD